MKKYLLLLGTIMIYTFTPFISNGVNQPYEAWLTEERSKSKIKITACCKNNTSSEVNIILKIIAEKKSIAGISKTTQSKSIFLQSNEKKCLSQIVFNFSANDEYQINLEAYKDNLLVAKDYIVKGRKNEQAF